MVDPTSDHGEVSEEEAPTCTVCDEPLVEDPDHTVVTWVEGDGVRTAHFCSRACRENWDDER